jgi:GAF domain-containing protein
MVLDRKTGDELSDILELTLDIFQQLNRAETQHEAIEQILRELKDHIGVSATGIRLGDNGDYPYYFFDGFSDAHIEIENSLCDHLNGPDYQLACMCGRVLQERTDPSLPFFTEAGSFWTNNTDRLIQVSTIEELGETRNVCNAEGYLSVALIPLRNSDGVIGLLQLNDENPDRFSPEVIEYLEKIGEGIGVALSRLDEEDQRKALEQEREKLLQQYQLRIKELDTLYRISKLQENPDLTVDEILNLIIGFLPGATQYPRVAVARLTIEDKVYESVGYRSAPHRYSALIQNFGVVVGRLVIGYVEEKPREYKGPFLEEEVKLVNLISESVSRMLERKQTGEWRRSIDKYALILNDEEMRHITKLVLEDVAIGEMDREEYNIDDLPEGSTQSMESYMTLQYNLELNRGLIMKLQNLLNVDELI